MSGAGGVTGGGERRAAGATEAGAEAAGQLRTAGAVRESGDAQLLMSASAWEAAGLESLRAELQPWLGDGGAASGGGTDTLDPQPYPIPEQPGGWWHQYVCPVHHDELLYDPAETDAHEFRCPHGCVWTGEPYRGAWLVYRHQQTARLALSAAVLHARTGGAAEAELARGLLVAYARQFPRYPVHPDAQAWMLKGRAFHQALTEAIWATTLLRTYLLLRDAGVQFDAGEREALDVFFGLLRSSMEEYRGILIEVKRNPENNYMAWLNAALAGLYAASGDEAGLRGLIEGVGGWRHHLTIGVKPDQLEFEGSIYYHVFVLRAYLIFAEMADRFGIDVCSIAGDQGQSVRGMLDVLTVFADEQGELEATHDGPYMRLPYAREIAEIFEIGYKRFGDASYVPLLEAAYRRIRASEGSSVAGAAVATATVAAGGTNLDGLRTGLEAVLYGGGAANVRGEAEAKLPERRLRLLADSGFAVLRRSGAELTAWIDFGEHGGSHGHCDKLHVSVRHRGGAVAPDPGMVPYGSSMRAEWYRETACHNTVLVNGQSQAEHTGELVRCEDGAAVSAVRVRSDAAYPGCVIERELTLTDEALSDLTEVRLQEAGVIEWRLHPAGPWELLDDSGRAVEWEEAQAEEAGQVAGGSGGWQGPYERPMGQGTGEETATTSAWRLLIAVVSAADAEDASGEASGLIRIPLTLTASEAGTELLRYSEPGTADAPSKRRYGLLLRTAGTAASFHAHYGEASEGNQED